LTTPLAALREAFMIFKTVLESVNGDYEENSNKFYFSNIFPPLTPRENVKYKSSSEECLES
jgi:hypothetical protein